MHARSNKEVHFTLSLSQHIYHMPGWSEIHIRPCYHHKTDIFVHVFLTYFYDIYQFRLEDYELKQDFDNVWSTLSEI